MHEDTSLLDALERFTNDAGEFRAAITRMFLHHGERIVVVEAALLESIKDRARLRDENKSLRIAVAITMAWAALVTLLIVLAFMFGGRS